MELSELDYELPEELIAQQGLADRVHSRLLVLQRGSGAREDRFFGELGRFVGGGDCLVINDTKVIPARFFARRATGGKIEGLFLKEAGEGCWEVMLKNAARLRLDERLELISPGGGAGPAKAEKVLVQVVENQGEGQWRLRPESEESPVAILDRYGRTPLPPYISRKHQNGMEAIDHQRYQTVYADKPGSIAAPTAGLHFTPELLDLLQRQGAAIARVTLHVGLGTFKPITAARVEEHPMHSEYYEMDAASAGRINQTIEQGGRVIAVGTTSVRTLETLGRSGRVAAGSGWTDIFITPGYSFRIVKAMITNFHLPRSTLLALVCAFAGRELILDAYRHAIEQKYRFYSYGDAMLIL